MAPTILQLLDDLSLGNNFKDLLLQDKLTAEIREWKIFDVIEAEIYGEIKLQEGEFKFTHQKEETLSIAVAESSDHSLEEDEDQDSSDEKSFSRDDIFIVDDKTVTMEIS